jgi:Tol biopolymer transport system component
MTKLTFSGVAAYPVWTPDGKHIVYVVPFGESPGMYWIRSDGGGEPQRLTEERNAAPHSFSPDGKRLAYVNLGPDFGIWTLPLDLGDPEHPRADKPELFLESKFVLLSPTFSLDGRWIAYQALESGQQAIFVRPFPGPGGKWQISTQGGNGPVWSPNGRELFYRSAQMMVVPYIARGDSFAAGQPRPWLEKLFPADNFDLAPDGRFAVTMPTSFATLTDRPTHVAFLLNFVDDLKRRLP